MRLFEVKFLTKDTRLGIALVALEGIAYGKPEITPIRGAEIKGNKVKATYNGKLIDQVTKALNRRKGSEVTRHDVAELMQAHGGSISGVGALIQRLKARGVIKGKGIGHNGYKVIGGN